MDIQSIKELLKNGNLDQVFEELELVLGSSKEIKNFFALRSRYSVLKKESQNGILRDNDKEVKQNKIIFDLWAIISSHELKKSDKKNSTLSRWIWVGMVTAVVICMLFITNSNEGCILSKSRIKCKSDLSVWDIGFSIDSFQLPKYDGNFANKVKVAIIGQQLRTLEFAVENKYGDIEIHELWFEIVNSCQCTPADIFLDDEFADNDFYLNLTPQIKRYRILPATITNSLDSFSVKNESNLHFFARIWTKELSAIELKLCAVVYDAIIDNVFYVESDTFSFMGKRCFEKTNKYYVVGDVKSSTAPYLYKLMTNGGFWDNMTESNTDLNLQAFCEISKIIGKDPEQLKKSLENEDFSYFKNLKEYPPPLNQVLFEVSKRLNDKLFQ